VEKKGSAHSAVSLKKSLALGKVTNEVVIIFFSDFRLATELARKDTLLYGL